jgi:Flp pilus assembly protein TadD
MIISFKGNKNKLFLSASLAIFMSVSSPVLAQTELSLDDITLDLGGVPPQPVQTQMMDQGIPSAPPVDVIEILPEDVMSSQEVTFDDAVTDQVIYDAEASGDIVDFTTVELVESEELPTVSVAPPTAVLSAPEPELEDFSPASASAQAVTPPYSGQYFDADAIVARPAFGSTREPRQVDPRYEPGSSFVVVRKSAGADSRQAKIVAAQRAIKLGRYSSALELYEQLYKKTPRDKRVLMGLAVSQQNSGFTESAIATYEELLKIDPKNHNATANMLGLISQEYPAVAYRKLMDLWRKDSSNPAIAAQLGLASAEAGHTEEAIRFLGVAASIEPNNALHFYNMAIVTDQAGAHKDAVDLYQKAMELDAAYSGSRSIPREQVYDRLAQLRRL